METKVSIKEITSTAKSVKYEIQNLSTDTKNAVLRKAADLLVAHTEEILDENKKDIANAETNGIREAMVDRLTLTKERIEQMAEGVREVAELTDPIGECLQEIDRPNGIRIRQVRVPLGVVGIIYESRPNVTADAFSLCFKTGNVVILKGGSDALYSNIAIVNCLKEALKSEQVNENAVSLIASTDRKDTAEFMSRREDVDVLIPRGGAGLIRAVVEESKIPVIETGTGNCHIYIDDAADLSKAIPIIINAKTQRVSVCNAAESIVVHEKIKDEFLPLLAKAMKEHDVELHADEPSISLLPEALAATEEDFGREYLDYKLSVKTVQSLEEAIAHINHYHTGHSDCIITENMEHAKKFLQEVDSACVYHNVSTRFSDGFEFGFGAEIGISTQKLHARGPMGLPALTSYKYEIEGDGQTR